MSHTATLKKYPRLQLCHQAVDPKDHVRIPPEAILGLGPWANVNHGDFRIWCRLRWAFPKEGGYKNRSHLANTIGVDQSNLDKAAKRLTAAGVLSVVETDATRYWKTLVPGEGKPQTESQDQQPKKEKKEEEKKTEQPATRQKPLPPKRVETLAPSGGLSAQLVDAWNKANTRGLAHEDVNAGAFKPETVAVIQYIADRYDSTPQEVIRRVVVAIDRDDYQQPPTPVYIFNEANKDMFGYCFSELVKARQWAAIEKKEQQDIELVTAAYDGLSRGYESMDGFKTEIPESLDVVLYNEYVEDFTSQQVDVLRAVCVHYDLELSPATAEKLGYWFSRKCSDGRVERISLYNMGVGFGYDSNKHLQPYMDAAVKQLQAGD